MQIDVLGPLEVRDDAGVGLEVTGARLHALLTRLALDAGRPVPARVLVDAVWGERPPAEEANALQTLVSRLRRALGSGAIVAAAGGYRLAADTEQVDALRFERLAADGARALRAEDHPEARRLLTEALALWRGDALVDTRGTADALAAHATRLDELRLTATVDRIEADLTLGEAAAVLAELDTLVAGHPLHERLAAQLVRALAAAGRPADALAAYERVRSRLVEELGTDPSAELQELHRALLQGRAEPTRRPTRRTNVRAQLTSFVGREAEVARIAKSLEGNRLVTLVGPGGAGKTRLAGEAAGAVLDDVRDGVWLVELAPVTAGADVPQAALDAVGLRDVVTIDRRVVSGGDAASRLVDGLADKDVLLVLDNCEHVVEAAAGLADLLLAQCRGLRVLATSREPLGIVGEVLLAVPPLGAPAPSAGAEEALQYAAVQLFADRAAAVLPGFVVDERTVGTVTEIVRRLDGLPLAIELAAARLRSLPLAEIGDRLSDRFRLLTGGSRTVLPRHRTLRAVVEWSWELLDDAEKLLAEQLAVFPSGVTVESATAISDAAPEDVPDLLASLVDRSLLQRIGDGRRLRMLETIREYGIERLGERGELGDVRARHADHFAELMADAEPHLLTADQLPWVDLLRAERENLVAAMRHLCDVGAADRALRLAVGMSCHGMTAGLGEEMAAWLDEALAVPGGEDAALRTLAEGTQLLSLTASSPTAVDIETGMERMRELGEALATLDGSMTPWVHVVRIGVAWFGGQPELTRSALAAADRSPDEWVRAIGQMFRAMLAENDGDPEAMRVANAAALADFERIGERWGLNSALRTAAQLATLDGDLDLAVRLYSRAMELSDQLNSTDDEAWTTARIAELELRRGNVDAARRLIDDAMVLAERGGSPLETVFATAMLAAVELRSGNVEDARTLQQQALATMQELPREHPIQGHVRTLVLCVTARMLGLDGDLTEGERVAGEAVQVALATRDMPMIASAVVATAELAARDGRFADGARALGIADVLRGAPDATALDVVVAVDLLRAGLGDEAYAAAYAEGAGLEQSAAVALLETPARR